MKFFIFSKTLEDHLIHIHKVFHKLREEKLLINLKKCSFVKKVKAILKWPTPRDVTKVRSFHGLASFYKKFIRGFSSICGPLIEIMRGNRKEFKWNVGAHKSFNLLK